MEDAEMFDVMRAVTGGKPWVLLTVEGVEGGTLQVSLSAGCDMDRETAERTVSLTLDALRRDPGDPGTR